MNNLDKTSIYFVGHFAVDTIIRFRRINKQSLGGSVTFGSLALKTYTDNANISIISHLGEKNFNKSLIRKITNHKIDLKGIKYSKVENTNFVLDYYNHSRNLTLKSRSPDLDFNHIPKEYIENPPDVIVLVPICNEISTDYVSQIVKNFPNAFIGIDLQGFIRKIDESGKVSYIYDENIISNMKKIINIIGNRLILKGSEEEMKLLAGENEDLDQIMNYFLSYEIDGIFIMTLGEKGSRIIKKGERLLKIPAFKAKRVIDETGAGDVYLSIFLYEFINSDRSWNSVERAANLGSVAASFLVEKKGPAGFKKKESVLRRLNKGKFIE